MNFPAKRRFITEFDGLAFLASLLNDEIATSSTRLYKKLLILINDLVVNDDMIIPEDPKMVRNYFGVGDNQVMKQLLKHLTSTEAFYAGDLLDGKMSDIRCETLRILFRVYQCNPQELA